jgi:hypothetical protein
LSPGLGLNGVLRQEWLNFSGALLDDAKDLGVDTRRSSLSRLLAVKRRGFAVIITSRWRVR